jgi:hypothetical protein
LIVAAQVVTAAFTFDDSRLTLLDQREKNFQEVMQTYIKYCGRKKVLTGLWKNRFLFCKRKSATTGCAFQDQHF